MTDQEIIEHACQTGLDLASRGYRLRRRVVWQAQLRGLYRSPGFRDGSLVDVWAPRHTPSLAPAAPVPMGLLACLIIGCVAGPAEIDRAGAGGKIRIDRIGELATQVPWRDMRRLYERSDVWLHGAVEGWDLDQIRGAGHGDDPVADSHYRRGVKVGQQTWRRMLAAGVADA